MIPVLIATALLKEYSQKHLPWFIMGQVITVRIIAAAVVAEIVTRTEE